MAKLTTRQETGRLVIDFTYRGVRCREQTALVDNPANRKRAEPVLRTLREAIRTGSFVYGSFFPGSPHAARFEEERPTAGATAEIAAEPPVPEGVCTQTSPTLADFTTIWLAEHEVEWRRSHQSVLRSTLSQHVLPRFGSRPVHSIDKADVLAFRADLAQRPGRAGSRLSNKRIMGPLRQILAEAADRHGFVSPATNIKPLRLRRTDVQPFTLDQVQQILARVRPDWRNYFAVRFFTGMRTGEAHGLKWKYVDFGQRLILIRETFVLGEDEYT